MWLAVAIVVGSYLIARALAPNPNVKIETAVPEAAQVPIADPGAPIPVIFGTVELKQPCVLSADTATAKPIKQGGNTVGYKYHMTIRMALCHGPIDNLRRIMVEGKPILSYVATDDAGAIEVDQPNLFGGDTGGGGIVADIGWSKGGYAITTADGPAYRGIATALIGAFGGQAYLGTSPYLKPFTFFVSRMTKRLDGSDQWYPEKVTASVSKGRDSYWRYAVYDNTEIVGGTPVQSTPYYDDSTWTIAQGPFASFAGPWQGLPSANTTTLPTGAKNVWLRHDFGPMPARDYVFQIWFNDSAQFWFNGTSYGITAGTTPTGAPWTGYVAIPASAINETGNNVVAVRVMNQIPSGDAEHFYAGLALMTTWSETGEREAMNPAHIIRECLTDTSGTGLGIAEALINDDGPVDSFEQAADTLAREKLGLCLTWNDAGAELLDFVKEVLRHINGVLYCDRSTGKMCLKLIRNDYDPEVLPIFDETNTVSVSNLERKAVGDLVNTVQVEYEANNVGELGSVTVSDQALVQVQGSITAEKISYPGITDAKIASALASRDLLLRSSPLHTVDLVVNREGARLNIGDPFMLRWSQYGIGASTAPADGVGDPDWDHVILLVSFSQGAAYDVGPLGVLLLGSTPATGYGIPHYFTERAVVGKQAVSLTDQAFVQVDPTTPTGPFVLSGDYTVEGWAFFCGVGSAGTNPSAWGCPCGNWTGSTGWAIGIDADGNLRLAAGTDMIDTGYDVPLYTWLYLAVTRSGSTTRVFVDGELIWSGADLDVATDFPLPSFGRGYFFGYLDEWRMTNGTARYTEAFTKPWKRFPRGAQRTGMVLRVASIDLGSTTSGAVSIRAIEDVFTPAGYGVIGAGAGESQPDTSAPTAGTTARFELPYWLLRAVLGQGEADAILGARPDAGFVGALSEYVAGAINAILYVARDYPALTLTNVGVMDLCPSAVIDGSVSKYQTAFDIDTASANIDVAQVGDLCLLYYGGTIHKFEWCVLTAIDTVAGTFSLRRGCLDTFPQEFSSATVLFSAVDYLGRDTFEFNTLYAPAIQVCPTNSNGTAATHEPTSGESVDVTGLKSRAFRPLPPGDVKINGTREIASIGADDDTTITWVHRNRTNTAISGYTDATDTAEAGQTYTLRIYGDLDAEMRTVSGIAGSPYVYTTEDELVDTGGTVGDPNYSSVSVLLHGDGSAGGTTFTDNGPGALTFTRNTKTTETTQKKFGTASIYSSGSATSHYLKTTAYTPFQFGAGAFTIEAWVYPTSLGSIGAICALRDAGVAYSWQLEIRTDGKLYLRISTNGTYDTATPVSTGTVSANTWTHIAVVRSGDTLYFFINGAASGSATLTGTLYAANVDFTVGSGKNGSSYYEQFTGYIDDLRITKGVARYTSAFDAPTEAFPDNGGTGALNSSLRIVLSAVRDGYESAQYEHRFNRSA